MRRPACFSAVAFSIARVSATLPEASRIIDQSNRVILPARKCGPYRDETTTCPRAGWGACQGYQGTHLSAADMMILTCLPGIGFLRVRARTGRGPREQRERRVRRPGEGRGRIVGYRDCDEKISIFDQLRWNAATAGAALRCVKVGEYFERRWQPLLQNQLAPPTSISPTSRSARRHCPRRKSRLVGPFAVPADVD